jgi:putative ABC transport system substrate-binding protein
VKRRQFIAGVGATAAGWPMVAPAQQAIPVVGFLSPASADTYTRPLSAFRAGLKETGYIEDQNVSIEYRWAKGEYARLAAMAADLAKRNVAVIAATSDTSAQVAKLATTKIPIVFSSANDPVDRGLVASLNRPGGNLTGVSRLNTDLEPKRLDLLHEVAPDASVIAVLVNPTSAVAEYATQNVQAAGRLLRRQILVLKASTDEEIEVAFASVVRERVRALLIVGNSFFNARTEQLGALTLRHELAAIHQLREFTVAGGLMSYGSSLSDAFHLVGIYVGRILKGAIPSDLPVQQAVKAELVINVQTAKKFGLTFPLPLIGRADEVIE